MPCALEVERCKLEVCPKTTLFSQKALKKILCLATAVLAIGSLSATEPPIVPPFEDASWAVAATPIDACVLAALEARGIEPAHPCSDAVFVRRVHFDVVGTLPSPADVRGFLEDSRPNKPAARIDDLLARDSFADYWAMKWCDLLRVKAG